MLLGSRDPAGRSILTVLGVCIALLGKRSQEPDRNCMSVLRDNERFLGTKLSGVGDESQLNMLLAESPCRIQT